MKANVTRKTTEQAAYDQGIKEGCQYAMLLSQIVLNDKFKFGKTRLELFENDVVELAKIIPNGDEMLSYDAVQRFRKIRGIKSTRKGKQ